MKRLASVDLSALSAGPTSLPERPVRLPRAALTRIAGSRFELVSCMAWRTYPGWSIPPRSCPDSLLFVPIAGSVELRRGESWHQLSPGQIGVLPTMLGHAARLAAGTRSWQVIAVHCHARDAVGSDLFLGLGGPVMALPDHPAWLERLADLVALAGRDWDAAGILAAALLPMLVCDLLAAGATWDEPSAPDPRIAIALRALHADLRATRSISALAKLAGLSPGRFRATFQAATGISPKRYQDRLRLSEAARRLHRSTDPVRAIATDLGFASDHHLHHRFKLAYGCTPSAWRLRAGEAP